MLSVFLVFVCVICLGLIMVWSGPAIPPLNRQYHTPDEDPAWQGFRRQRRWHYIFVGAVANIAAASIYLAIGLL